MVLCSSLLSLSAAPRFLRDFRGPLHEPRPLLALLTLTTPYYFICIARFDPTDTGIESVTPL